MLVLVLIKVCQKICWQRGTVVSSIVSTMTITARLMAQLPPLTASFLSHSNIYVLKMKSSPVLESEMGIYRGNLLAKFLTDYCYHSK